MSDALKREHARTLLVGLINTAIASGGAAMMAKMIGMPPAVSQSLGLVQSFDKWDISLQSAQANIAKLREGFAAEGFTEDMLADVHRVADKVLAELTPLMMTDAQAVDAYLESLGA